MREKVFSTGGLDENLKSRKLEMKVRADLGIKQTAVSKAEISDLEPNLQPIFDSGVLFDYAGMQEILIKFQKDYLICILKKVENLLKKMLNKLNR